MMSCPRFYVAAPLAAHTEITLPEAVARHASRVLRLGMGDALTLFDGRGGEYPARLIAISRDAVRVEVGAHQGIERESPLTVRLAQGISSGERMDYTLQKAVELGVTAIQPLALKRSVVKLAGERETRRLAHWQGVVVAACEQCGRNRVPPVAAPATLDTWLQGTLDGRLIVLSPEAPLRLADLPPPTQMDTLVAGPEGGFDPAEMAQLLAAGAIPVRLGARVLRTETAALAALAAMQTRWGDF